MHLVNTSVFHVSNKCNIIVITFTYNFPENLGQQVSHNRNYTRWAAYLSHVFGEITRFTSYPLSVSIWADRRKLTTGPCPSQHYCNLAPTTASGCSLLPSKTGVALCPLQWMFLALLHPATAALCALKVNGCSDIISETYMTTNCFYCLFYDLIFDTCVIEYIFTEFYISPLVDHCCSVSTGLCITLIMSHSWGFFYSVPTLFPLVNTFSCKQYSRIGGK